MKIFYQKYPKWDMQSNELKQIVRNLNRLRTLGKLDLIELGQQKKDLTQFVPEFRLSRTIKLLFILGVLTSLLKSVTTHGIKINSTIW